MKSTSFPLPCKAHESWGSSPKTCMHIHAHACTRTHRPLQPRACPSVPLPRQGWKQPNCICLLRRPVQGTCIQRYVPARPSCRQQGHRPRANAGALGPEPWPDLAGPPRWPPLPPRPGKAGGGLALIPFFGAPGTGGGKSPAFPPAREAERTAQCEHRGSQRQTPGRATRAHWL